ncbi:hypothetical protein BK734_09070 [Bacillus thuringiensis serovar kim]|nr:hypothetical protein BK734_09070 [Bacillus thuringiensis serovar kim]
MGNSLEKEQGEISSCQKLLIWVKQLQRVISNIDKNKWQSRDRFLAGNVPVVLEIPCYICIVRSGGKHNSLCCF